MDAVTVIDGLNVENVEPEVFSKPFSMSFNFLLYLSSLRALCSL